MTVWVTDANVCVWFGPQVALTAPLWLCESPLGLCENVKMHLPV